MQRFIYADNAATTQISKDVLNVMLPYLGEKFGNPSSMYGLGRKAREAVEQSREVVADCIKASPGEIFFTSGGSESDNWAIKGVAYAQKKKGKNHIITTVIEHHAVLHTVKYLERNGFEVTYIGVSSDGIVSPDEIRKAIKKETCLVSVMYANNEIGTIQPISEIGKICKEEGVVFHTDAVQAIGNIDIDVKEQNIDLLSLSAHKFHGPKGVGALYIRKGVRLDNLIEGGAQERGRRGGTENTAGIVGLAEAMKIACCDIEKKAKRLSGYRDRIIESALKIERSRLNGDAQKRLPGNVNMCFEGIEGESLLLMLDMKGICASSGSACTSGSLEPSHVLLSIGLPHEIAHGSLRLSLGEDITDEDVEYINSNIGPIVEKLRAMSPLWEKIKKEEKE